MKRSISILNLILINLIIGRTSLSNNGLNYKEPESVKQFFRDPGVTIPTPSIEGGRSEFTTQKEMLDYLGNIHTTSNTTVVDLLGPTDNKNYLPVFLISKDKSLTFKDIHETAVDGKPIVMLIAQQHGNEPMGCDTLLATVKRVAKGDLNYILNRVNIIVMPRINPDGAKKFTRESGEKIDINGDHSALVSVEAQAVSYIYNKFKPEVFIDIHEYISDLNSYSHILSGGAVPYYDLLILNPTNPNYSKSLKEVSDKTLLQLKETLKQNGYTSNYYYNPFIKPKKGEPLTLYRATGSAKLARNNYGLKGSLSYLIELRGRQIGFENVRRRLKSGMLSVEILLKDTYANSDRIKKVVENEKNRPHNSEKISSEIVKEKSSIELIDTNMGQVVSQPALIIREKM
ncbi:M14 family zinc carboxypeptidase [uncultured Cetobacterium sp.]|uniref:M14 family zinc carboxypeptidase n=1 Tax=uncultured Cetobacterium sp. TaxID=527638 RepID=UPI00262A055D|nr:M14 family zinc carboxypeptidase [uncultured Cetobacterium sp.]